MERFTHFSRHWLYGKFFPLRLSLFFVLLLAAFTTASQAQGLNGVAPRIIGGSNANPSAYPWAAALIRANSSNAFNGQFCGGTLIDDRWILTAAHCVDSFMSADEIEVAVGISNLNNVTNSDRIAVNGIYVHPGYSDSSSDNDIALLELATPSSNTVLAVADNTLTNAIAVGELMTIIGWGSTNTAVTIFPAFLQETQIPLFNFASCNSVYNNLLTSNMICAGFAAGGKDTCQGDSGGPIMYFNTADNTFYQTGVTSFGNGCAVPNNPGVYTRAANYLDWIEDTTTIALTNRVRFGYHGIGGSLSLPSANLTLRNFSDSAITVSAITLSNQTNFSITSENCSGSTIPVNEGCSISLQFLAAIVGLQQATLGIDLGTGNPLLNSIISGTVLGNTNAASLDELPARDWFSGGNAPWSANSVSNSNGGTAMRSGTITNNQNTVLLGYFTGPETLSYRWKSSTETGFDSLNLYVDDVLINSISGNRDWGQCSVNLGAGEHRVVWA